MSRISCHVILEKDVIRNNALTSRFQTFKIFFRINKGDDTLHKTTKLYIHVQGKANKKAQRGYFKANEVNVCVDFDHVSCKKIKFN